MPARKQPKTLQTLTLQTIGDNIFRRTVVKITEKIVSESRSNKSDYIIGIPQFKSRKRNIKMSHRTLIEYAVEQLQECLFEETAHYFHAKIIKECLVRQRNEIGIKL